MTLETDGYVRFTDPEAADCFGAFQEWAARVSETEYADSDPAWHTVVRTYLDLREMESPDKIATVPSFEELDTEPFAAWVDAGRYQLSQALLRGFFQGQKNFIGDVISRVRSLRHAWVQLARELSDQSNQFSPDLATTEVDLQSIELQQTDQASFVTSSTSDGRHRTMAMIALGAPVLPVQLRLLA